MKIRASEAGKLMTGGNAITTKQLDRLGYLEARLLEPGGKPLTENMEKELIELIQKRDAPFELGGTAKSLVRDIWLRQEFGYEEPVMTPQLQKGLLCEQDSLRLVTQLLPSGEFRIKNRETYYDDDLTGTPDVVLKSDKIIEDVKTSWTVKTFWEANLDPLYYAQGQVYMELLGFKRFRLIYCLVDTPAELVLEEHKRFFFKFGADDENPEYLNACEKLDRMHYPSRVIPAGKRLKFFEFNHDPEFIAELRKRIKVAREYYDTLSLANSAPATTTETSEPV